MGQVLLADSGARLRRDCVPMRTRVSYYFRLPFLAFLASCPSSWLASSHRPWQQPPCIRPPLFSAASSSSQWQPAWPSSGELIVHGLRRLQNLGLGSGRLAESLLADFVLATHGSQCPTKNQQRKQPIVRVMVISLSKRAEGRKLPPTEAAFLPACPPILSTYRLIGRPDQSTSA